MRSTLVRRLSAAVIVPAFAVGTLAVTSAQAAPSPAVVVAATNWLAGQPNSETHIFTSYYEDFETGDPVAFVDYGLNLDLYAALDSLGSSVAAEQVFDATIDKTGDYVTQFGTTYAGNLGKVAAMVQAHGDDASNVDGIDVIEDLEDLVVTSGDETGRGKDAPDGPYQSTNVINQGWVVRALSNADSDLADEAITYLLKQQCDNGSFREDMSGTACTTSPASVDATAFSVVALQVAAAHGVTGLADDINDATDWLVSIQAANGSFTDAGSPNTNSAGVAAAALEEAGQTAAATKAADWIVGRQLTSGAEAGAVAHNDADLATAQVSGITTLSRDSFVRAAVQAVLAYDALPGKTFTVTRPSGYAQAGSKVVISAAGLAPGELASIGSFSKKAASTGKVALGYTAPATTGTHTATVTSGFTGRGGSVSVKVLASKALTPTVKFPSRARGGTQRVNISGLAAGETVAVIYGGKTLVKTRATGAGTFTYAFKVGTSKGTKQVKVQGAFSNRSGVKSFKVT